MNNSHDLLSSFDELKKNYKKEGRPIIHAKEIVIKGSVDVYFRRSDKPLLIVAGDTQEAIDAVKTRLENGRIVIENEGIGVQLGGFSFGNVSIVAGGSIYINGQNITMGGSKTQVNHGRAVVCISLPEIQAISIKGSADITLLDLKQAGIELDIQGSGDINASGEVDHLEVTVAGSGDVDARDLKANSGNLSVAGSGDIRAHITQSACASVAGSGDIVVSGNPLQRSKKIAGSGSVKFK